MRGGVWRLRHLFEWMVYALYSHGAAAVRDRKVSSPGTHSAILHARTGSNMAGSRRARAKGMRERRSTSNMAWFVQESLPHRLWTSADDKVWQLS